MAHEATVEPLRSPVSPPDDLLGVWEGLREIGRPELLRVASEDSCIAASRLCQEVLTYFGMPSKCSQSFVVAANKRFQELANEDRINFNERLPDWAVEEGAWAIGMGAAPSDPIDAPGHVVCLTGMWLLDLSLDQASRPQRNMVLEPALLPVGYDYGELRAYGITGQGATIIWRVLPQRTSAWKARSPDWTEWEARYGFIAGKVIKYVRDQRKEASGD